MSLCRNSASGGGRYLCVAMHRGWRGRYRCQNFEGGSFSYLQVDLACRALRERAGRPPLLILPAGYLKMQGDATCPVGGLVPNHTRSNRLNESQVQ